MLFINFSPVFNNKIMENRKFINEQHENTTTTFGYRHIKVITNSRIVFPECFQMHIIYPGSNNSLLQHTCSDPEFPGLCQ